MGGPYQATEWINRGGGTLKTYSLLIIPYPVVSLSRGLIRKYFIQIMMCLCCPQSLLLPPLLHRLHYLTMGSLYVNPCVVVSPVFIHVIIHCRSMMAACLGEV